MKKPHGGPRPNSGRKKGSPNKLAPVETPVERVKRCVESGLTPLEFLLGIMRDTNEELSARLEAAGKAAQFVHKKQPIDVNNTVSFPTPRPVTLTHTAPPGLPDDATASRN